MSTAIPQADAALLAAQAQAGQAGVAAYEAAKAQMSTSRTQAVGDAMMSAQHRGAPAGAMESALAGTNQMYDRRDAALTTAEAAYKDTLASRDSRMLDYSGAVGEARGLIGDQAARAVAPIDAQSRYSVSNIEAEGRQRVDAINAQMRLKQLEMDAAYQEALRKAAGGGGGGGGGSGGGGGGGGGGTKLDKGEMSAMVGSRGRAAGNAAVEEAAAVLKSNSQRQRMRQSWNALGMTKAMNQQQTAQRALDAMMKAPNGVNRSGNRVAATSIRQAENRPVVNQQGQARIPLEMTNPAMAALTSGRRTPEQFEIQNPRREDNVTDRGTELRRQVAAAAAEQASGRRRSAEIRKYNQAENIQSIAGLANDPTNPNALIFEQLLAAGQPLDTREDLMRVLGGYDANDQYDQQVDMVEMLLKDPGTARNTVEQRDFVSQLRAAQNNQQLAQSDPDVATDAMRASMITAALGMQDDGYEVAEESLADAMMDYEGMSLADINTRATTGHSSYKDAQDEEADRIRAQRTADAAADDAKWTDNQRNQELDKEQVAADNTAAQTYLNDRFGPIPSISGFEPTQIADLLSANEDPFRIMLGVLDDGRRSDMEWVEVYDILRSDDYGMDPTNPTDAALFEILKQMY